MHKVKKIMNKNTILSKYMNEYTQKQIYLFKYVQNLGILLFVFLNGIINRYTNER